jgi:hypothetical protein
VIAFDAAGRLTGRFRTSFSRAVHGLVERGWLGPVAPVPEGSSGWQIAALDATGDGASDRSGRLRFVRRGETWEEALARRRGGRHRRYQTP